MLNIYIAKRYNMTQKAEQTVSFQQYLELFQKNLKCEKIALITTEGKLLAAGIFINYFYLFIYLLI